MQAAAPSQDTSAPYTLHEAAQLLGVSLNTVRRKIARGELKATRSARPQGHVWHVWLERTQGSAQHPTQGSTQHPADLPNGYVQDAGSVLAVDRSAQLLSALVPLVEAAVAPLRAELADVRATLSTRDQELGHLRGEIERLQEALAPVLEPTSPERPISGDSEHATVELTQTPAEVPKRAWWHFW